MKQIKYRSLKRWKYQLKDVYIDSAPVLGCTYQDNYLSINSLGALIIHRGYCWDGPSGPTIDTKNTMRASLVHDALYQLIRKNILPVTFRKEIDDHFRQQLIEDGMSKFRAWYYWKSVRLFGKKYATMREQPEKIHIAP
jgi:hypothetical protein